MRQTTISFRADAELKQDFDSLCRELGMNMSTAFTVFMKQMCRENRLPFSIQASSSAHDQHQAYAMQTGVATATISKESEVTP